jgi:Protein of unknown function (DUF3311)
MPPENTQSSSPIPTTPAAPRAGAPPRRGSQWRWYLLLVAPFVGMLWVPFYNRVEPRIGSIPFFYWYQFAWIGISAVLTIVVYLATREAER